MGCGASVHNFPLPDCSSVEIVRKVLGRRDSDWTEDYAIKHYQDHINQQVNALCFSSLKSLIFRRPSPPPQRASRRPKPNPMDLQFIEQRVRIESNEDDFDDNATSKTDSTTNTRLTMSTNHSNKIGTMPLRQAAMEEGKPGQPRSFFQIAMDYNKKMDSIKAFQPTKPATTQPATIFVEPKREDPLKNEPPAIIQHISRREFLEQAAEIKTPPLIHRRVITPIRNNSVHGSRETLSSERSFIVVHNTLKVAWEKDILNEKIQEQRRLQRLKRAHLRWHSVDSSCSGSSESAEGPEPTIIYSTNRRDWSRELDEIVRLD